MKSFEERGELADLDRAAEHYFGNRGFALVLLDAEKVVGTGAIRCLDDGTAELKRMWFLPDYRGRGLGYQMASQLINFAKDSGYERVRLDTSEKQTAALRLYTRLGFTKIPRYNDGVCTIFMELVL